MNVYPFLEAQKAQQGNVARAYQPLEVSRSACYQIPEPHPRLTRDSESPVLDGLAPATLSPLQTAQATQSGTTPRRSGSALEKNSSGPR